MSYSVQSRLLRSPSSCLHGALPSFVVTALSVCVLSLPSAAVTVVDKKPASQKAEATAAAGLEAAAAELEAALDKINTQHSVLLNDPWLRWAITHFGAAQLAAKSLAVDGKANPVAVNKFHNAMDAFIRALDDFPNWTPGTSGWGDVKGTQRPKGSLLKAARTAAAAVKAKANAVPAFREVGLTEFSDATTLDQAVEYGALVMERIEGLLYTGGLEQITGEGKRATNDAVGKSLEALKESLAALGDDSATAEGDAKDTSDFDKRRAAAKACALQFRKDAGILSNAFRPAKPRVELVLPDLDRLEKNLAKLRAPKK